MAGKETRLRLSGAQSKSLSIKERPDAEKGEEGKASSHSGERDHGRIPRSALSAALVVEIVITQGL